MLNFQKNLKLDGSTVVIKRGITEGIHWECSAHCFNENYRDSSFSYPFHLALYLILTEEQHEKYKAKLQDLNWHGGVTYYRKHTQSFMDTNQFKDESYYKIGCDFQHYGDEHHLHDYDYDMERLERIAKRLATELVKEIEGE